jgi:hypothetical protein
VKCNYCGAAIPENARFCAGCGRALSGATMSVPNTADPTPTRANSKAKWWAIGVGVLLLMAIAFVVGTQSGLITRANVQKPDAPSVLEAQPPKVDAPSVLEAQPPKVDAPSVLETEAPKPPPKHVVDWLEHLRETEERRRRMERNIAPVMSMLVQATLARAAALGGVAQGDLEKAEADYEREREKLRQRLPATPTRMGATARILPQRAPATRMPNARRRLLRRAECIYHKNLANREKPHRERCGRTNGHARLCAKRAGRALYARRRGTHPRVRAVRHPQVFRD